MADRHRTAILETRDSNSLSRLGKLADEGLTEDTTGAILEHIENFTDYTDDTLKNSVSGGNPDRLLSKIDEYDKDFAEGICGQPGRLLKADR